MKASELRNLSLDELTEKLNQTKKLLMQQRFQSSTGKLERQHTISQTRHDIARILTVMNESRPRGDQKKKEVRR